MKINNPKDAANWLDDHLKQIAIIAGVCFVVFLLVLWRTHHTTSFDNNLIYQQNQQISGLKNSISIKKAAQNKKERKANAAITGLDYAKQDKDNAVANDLFSLATTWENGAEYRKNRSDIIKKYGIPGNSTFMKTFMPPLNQTGMVIGNNGTNRVDSTNANMKFLRLHSYITDISGTTYSYLTIITTQTHDKKGQTTTSTIAARYTIDGQEKIRRLSATNIGVNNNNGQ